MRKPEIRKFILYLLFLMTLSHLVTPCSAQTRDFWLKVIRESTGQAFGNIHFVVADAKNNTTEYRVDVHMKVYDDEVIQNLVVQARELEGFVSTTMNLPEAERRYLEKLQQHTADLMQGLRRLGQSLRPPVLDYLSLLPALEWLATDITQRSGIVINVNVIGTPRRLHEEGETLLFRVAQEALRNVWRHSEAAQAEMTVEFSEHEARITVSDNGKGSNLPKALSDLARDGKLGLTGIQERVLPSGGRLSVQSQPGEGTSLTIRLPS